MAAETSRSTETKPGVTLIEVTPEMRRAGVAVMDGWLPRSEAEKPQIWYGVIVDEIFKAMLKTSIALEPKKPVLEGNYVPSEGV